MSFVSLVEPLYKVIDPPKAGLVLLTIKCWVTKTKILLLVAEGVIDADKPESAKVVV